MYDMRCSPPLCIATGSHCTPGCSFVFNLLRLTLAVCSLSNISGARFLPTARIVFKPFGRVPAYSIGWSRTAAPDRRATYATAQTFRQIPRQAVTYPSRGSRSPLVRFGPARAGRPFRKSSAPERERHSPGLPQGGASFLLIAANTHCRRARTGKPGAMYVTVQTALDHATSLLSVFGAFVTLVQSVAKPFICRMSLRKANEWPKAGTEIRILDWLFDSRGPHNTPTGNEH